MGYNGRDIFTSIKVPDQMMVATKPQINVMNQCKNNRKRKDKKIYIYTVMQHSCMICLIFIFNIHVHVYNVSNFSKKFT